MVKVAKLDDRIVFELSNKFQQLFKWNVRPVFLSLFEQTIDEMAITRYLYSCKHIVQANARELMTIEDQVFATLSILR